MLLPAALAAAACSALGWALEEYKGTVICSSHDRDMLDRFAKKIIALNEDGIEFFDGPLEEYLKIREQK